MQATATSSEALRLARAGSAQAAMEVLEAALKRNPQDAEALQLMGMLLRKQGRLAEAEHFLRLSLRAAPSNAHVHNNLGNLFAQQNRNAEAIDSYRRALAVAPGYGDAWFNLGTVLLRDGDARAARDALQRAAAGQPQAAKIWAALGHANRRLDEGERARTAYLRALSAQSDHRGARHGLALVHRRNADFAAALVEIDHCLALAMDDPELHLSRGNVLGDLGRIDEALMSYRHALELKPDYREAHEALNNALWLYRAGEQHLDSYRVALDRAPRAAGLYIDLAQRLILLGHAAEARRYLQLALERGVNDASIHHCLARTLASQGLHADAHRELDLALAQDPQPQYQLDAARLSILANDPATALTHVDAALERTPDDQLAIAYRGVCWRLLGDAREPVLNDYAQLVRTFELEAPPGYASMTAFNDELARVLAQLHRTGRAPLDQTLRGGTQTIDDLFALRLPPVDALRLRCEAAIGEYLHGLPSDQQHPLMRRKTSAFRFSGSWSVRLTRAGYHVNHVHSQGWISSCYYVRVPDVASQTLPQAGWIKFGETNLNLGAHERIARLVQPKPGLLVLFPSYFFHGTTSFDTDEERTTVAFDVIPD